MGRSEGRKGGKEREAHKRLSLVHKVKGFEQTPVVMVRESVLAFPTPHPPEHLWAEL